MKKYCKFLLLILWMGLIFFFSAQPSQESTIQTNMIVEFMYKIFNCIFAGKVDFNTFNDLLFTPVRKLAHFSEFAILGVLFYINIKDLNKRPIVMPLLCSVLYAISDEIHQIFVPGRYCALMDVTIDACGAAFGILLVHLMISKWRKN